MLGSRLIDATAQSLAGQFFTKFANLIKSSNEAEPAKKPKPVKAAAKAKKPATKKLATKKPVAKKPAVKKPIAKKPATKKKVKGR